NNDENSVIYTGTHDNNTTLGWWKNESSEEQRKRVLGYIESENEIDGSNISSKFIEFALNSKAKIAIVPFQDILGLGDEAKMNRPSSSKGNWEWRIDNLSAADSFKKQLSLITEKYSRI
ncbi:MAG: 4-alpha-glucanotransferase, partial [Thermodesulfobacteriota bacterium]